MPTEGKLRLHPTGQTAETACTKLVPERGHGVSALPFVSRVAKVCYSHLGRDGCSQEADGDRRSQQEQARTGGGKGNTQGYSAVCPKSCKVGELIQATKAAQIPLEQGHQSLVQYAGVATSRGSISQGVEA